MASEATVIWALPQFFSCLPVLHMPFLHYQGYSFLPCGLCQLSCCCWSQLSHQLGLGWTRSRCPRFSVYLGPTHFVRSPRTSVLLAGMPVKEITRGSECYLAVRRIPTVISVLSTMRGTDLQRGSMCLIASLKQNDYNHKVSSSTSCCNLLW